VSRPSMWNVGRGGQNGIRFLFILATIGCLFSAVTVRANDWDANGASPPNGTFQVANNWNPNAVPGTTDTADFNISDTYTVTFNGIAGTAVLDVLAGDVSFESDSIFFADLQRDDRSGPSQHRRRYAARGRRRLACFLERYESGYGHCLAGHLVRRWRGLTARCGRHAN